MPNVLAMVPSDLQPYLSDFLKQHPGWTEDRAIANALSLFLLSHRAENDRKLARIYLNTLFQPEQLAV